tara:strand:- start:92 stop:244 length:153 start_codon:yes stop_codon:yes gene_type:complete
MQSLSSSADPAVSIGITLFLVLLGLTAFGFFKAFGPKSAKLTDPWDEHGD